MACNSIKISLGWSLLPFGVMMIAMAATIIVFKGDPHVPLMVGSITAGLVAWFNGYDWHHIESSLYEGIKQVLPAIVILMLVGLLISAWVAGGLVTAMIYYGLQLLSASYFLPSLMIICAVSTLVMGSSWSTIGTLGVAGLAIGSSMGIPEPAVVGAIVSGAFFGDKMSPLSDTTVLASGIAEVNMFDHIKHMLYTTVPASIIALIAFSLLTGSDSSQLHADQVNHVLQTIDQHFVVSAWLLLVPLIVPVLILCRVPTIPTLIVAIISGALCYLLIQGGDFEHLFLLLQEGYEADTDYAMVDKLLDQGGLEAMMYTVSLAIVAMTFGGIMERTGMLDRLVRLVLAMASTGRRLCAATVVSSFITNVVTAEQYISIIIPGRMYAQAYREHGLHEKNLSRALEDGGTVTSPLVPWSTDAIFVYSTLGISAWSYAPYAVLDYAVPLISIVISLTGVAIVKKEWSSSDTEQALS